MRNPFRKHKAPDVGSQGYWDALSIANGREKQLRVSLAMRELGRVSEAQVWTWPAFVVRERPYDRERDDVAGGRTR